MSDDKKNASVNWKVGEIVSGNFRIEKKLGRGGAGTVYLVLDQHNGLRYAAKRTHIETEEARAAFLREMKVWLDLPQHPHVLPLRFFRTIGEEHVIFTDYMEGGSLQKLLGAQRLSRMETVLDLAIQYAWGLHALHELGQVHQDVKPGNALLDGKGVLKVADFGLMRVRRAGSTSKVVVHGDGKKTHGATYAGHTDAYCSPEQWRECARSLLPMSPDRPGERITRHTDTWSWGLSVLAMFYGEDPPYNGPEALEVLEALQANPIQNAFGWILELPNAVADILRRCFQEKPTDRGPSLLEAADALVDLYPSLCGGQPYPREKPTFTKASERLQHDHDRRVGNVQWHDPFDWLKIAFLADVRDLGEVDRLITTKAISRKGQATADLALYNEAYRILDRLVQSGRSELIEPLADLCIQKSLVYAYLEDSSGCLRMYDRAITIYKRLVEQEGRRELENDLAMALMNKANTLQQMGQLTEAVALYDQGIAISQRLVDGGQRHLANELAHAHRLRDQLLSQLNDSQTVRAPPP